jgi:hypothetical protein
VFDKPVEYLANFTLDRDKINFFEKAQTMVDKQQKSYKARQKLQVEKL